MEVTAGAGTLPATYNPRGPGWFNIALPPNAAGQWCRLEVTVRTPEPWWAKILAEDQARGQVVREAFLGPLRRSGAFGRRGLLLHVPQHAGRLALNVITNGPGVAPTTEIQVLSRADAALRLLAAGWRKLPVCLRGDQAGLAGRIRTELGQAPARAGDAPPYSVWVQLHDNWGAAEREALAASRRATMPPDIEILITGEDPRAAIEDLTLQWLQPLRASAATAATAWQRLPDAWLLVLESGERLAPHALACFAHAIQFSPDARGFYADLDRLFGDARRAPLFKPVADPWLLATGLLTQGACAFHPDVALPGLPQGDHNLRAQMASSIPAAAFHHIPFILTHATGDVPDARSPSAGPPACAWPKISIVIPSACRRHHVLRCLRALLAQTDYPDFEILLAVSKVSPDDKEQRAILRQAACLPHVRILDLQMPAFNYAAVNNAACRHATGDLLLLLNDDVVPIRPDWLRRMVALTNPPGALAADIVGARLLYGNDRVQHGGVIMGLASLCEHAFRLTARDDAGPHGIALLDRQVSAVTAACMLVRNSLWNRMHGMDEDFAIALNDVDFCLRAGQTGARIVFAASVELHHYESLSLGRHYEGARAGLEAVEVQRLRSKWQSVIVNDPFYNHQASTEPGREFQPAFPPRLTPLCWIARDDPG